MSATTTTNTSKVSEWLANYPCPWWVDPGRVSHTVRDLKGDPICCLPPFEWDRHVAFEVQAKTAALISYAPELLANVAALLDVMRRTDREFTQSLDVPIATDEEWDQVIEDATAVIELLTDEGDSQAYSQALEQHAKAMLEGPVGEDGPLGLLEGAAP